MKVRFNHGIASFAGKLNESVFWPTPKGNGSFMRKHFIPRETDQSAFMAAVATNLSSIWKNISEAFKTDCTTYGQLSFTYTSGSNNPFITKLSGYAVFIKMMWTFAAANSASVTLDTITYNDIQSLFSDLTSIASAIESGYLPNVPGGDALTATM